jgi:hypothetical protein
MGPSLCFTRQESMRLFINRLLEWKYNPGFKGHAFLLSPDFPPIVGEAPNNDGPFPAVGPTIASSLTPQGSL